MSFRMRGQAYCAARYAATWVLIVSMSSSAVVMGAPTRRAAKKAKKNCCPQLATCSSCDECSSCHSGDVIAPKMAPSMSPTPAAPEKAPPDPKAENQVKIEPASSPMPAPPSSEPPAPDPGPASPTAASKSAESKLRSRTIHETGVSQENRPVIVREEAPPQPASRENETPAEATFNNETPNNETLNNETPNNESPNAIAPLTVEPPKPADGGSKYQEYLNRYFDRKNPAPSTPKEDAPTPPQEDAPILSPSKPAKEYNDPFRPTSYRSSPERTWRDSTGASRMKARFLGVDDKGMARMARDDGKISRVPLANMSKEDLRYIELLAIRNTITSPPQVIAAKPRR